MLGPGRGALRPRRRRRLLLLLHTGQAAARHLAHALLHVALRVEQRGAGQHQDGILLGQPAHDFDVIEIGQAGTDRHGRRLPVLEREDDVARLLTAAATEAAARASPPPPAPPAPPPPPPPPHP